MQDATLKLGRQPLLGGLAAALLLGPAMATAAIIQFETGGVINDTTAIVTPIPGIAPGLRWQVNATYAGELSDPGQVSSLFVTYQLLNYTLSVGPAISLTIVPSAAGLQSQTVRLDIGRSLHFNGSQYELLNDLEIVASNYTSAGSGAAIPITPGYTLDGRKLFQSFVLLEGPMSQLWGLDNRLTDALDYSLSDFATRRFVLTFEDDRTSAIRFETAFGSVDHYSAVVVPVPSAGLSLLSAFIVFMRARRQVT